VQAAGGAGLLVGAPSDSAVVQMDCTGAECDRDLAIPAAMIPPAAAGALQVPPRACSSGRPRACVQAGTQRRGCMECGHQTFPWAHKCFVMRFLWMLMASHGDRQDGMRGRCSLTPRRVAKHVGPTCCTHYIRTSLHDDQQPGGQAWG